MKKQKKQNLRNLKIFSSNALNKSLALNDLEKFIENIKNTYKIFIKNF